jgi:4-amino-4-deoxy-L-arabinose transferase-like glycosyltransferase
LRPDHKRAIQLTTLRRVIPAFWIVAMTVVYAITVTRALHGLGQSIPFRSDKRWLIVAIVGVVLLLAAVVLLVVQLRYRSFPVMRMCAVLLSATGLSAIVLRKQVLSALIIVWLVMLGYVWADWLLRRLGAKHSEEDLEWVVLASAMGLGLLSLLPLLPGLTGILTPRVILAILVAASAAQLRAMTNLLRRGRAWASGHWSLPHPGEPERATLECLMAAVVVFNLSWALSPELSFDALNYQIAVPRFYLESDAIIDLPYFWHSYFARLVNSLFVICLGLGGPIACKLLMLATGLMTTFAVYVLTLRFAGKRAALWASAMFYATPLVSWLSTVSYIDLTLAMFVTTAWMAFLRWRREGEQAWLISCAVLVGACIGSKPNGAFALPVMGIGLLWYSFRERELLRGVIDVTVFSLVALVIALPWYLLPWHWTGNPVFPLLNGVFRSPYWEPVNTMMNAGAFGIGVSPKALARLPFVVTFATRGFDEVLPSGGLGIGLVLLPIGVWLVVKQRRGWMPLIAVLVFFALWATTFQYARYLIPVLPMVVALSIGGVVEWARQATASRYCTAALWVALIAQGALMLPTYGNLAVRHPLQLILHQRSDEEFLRRTLPPYKAVEYLNSVTGPSDWVVTEGLEWLRYYVKARMLSLSESRMLRQQLVSKDDRELAARFSRVGYRYLVINRPYVTGNWPYLRDSFLENYATLEYSAESVEVYRLHEPEVERSAPIR